MDCGLQKSRYMFDFLLGFSTVGLFGVMADRSAFGLGTTIAVYFPSLCVAQRPLISSFYHYTGVFLLPARFTW